MFGRTTNDLSETLMKMQDEARIACKHNQTEMARKMAAWMKEDRRFDSIPDKVKLAKEAMDARSRGRVLNLTEPYRPQAGGVSV
ncbi:hypothetical protein NLM31_21045 [Bradyrhizobium sp. CCGUVB4N]|uniref:hypothetical protein n=1 Tax=Bradyrhizobium sp. CCGUVB4N TaxID=2949631 RepID=UPI0020B26BDA|nr:hypothetical protein [Bradyrhizobium sp. CCGUVB4N]MCP3382857.1 hypothetical protein [Bradyrhizobium sp. CCGUVB4N]